ncbi:hypothetical protein GCM10010211_16050 [Streptomyces albospinus]|uniref:Uncharacterized protein n=1 Tax=Streptomyces albospinus TaxID=285515 RepID=A0ABQ2UUG6_9ACTN|nr:hypothetical protein [Streptomyces albospinus]GGU52433.1 hypothetical protein GCM10010211_16050 [Streptomyces albospinus]
MTICASEDATALGSPHRAALTIAADGSYAARLARHDDAAGSWFPERWTIGGPEPYAVPLPGSQPEEPDSELLPLADGRVLILRRVADRFTVSLLYPTGPGTREVLLGAVPADTLTLLPPTPRGTLGYALAPGAQGTALWLVHGGAAGPERVAVVPGRCTGGAWLDHEGRLLALDQELDGRTKAVVVDLAHGGPASPLLQITEESNDRLLLADPDSGLLLVRSDAPGHDRLGWGVLGSSLPVRFPECLRAPDMAVTPFAVQPGRMLLPDSCAVAFRIDAASGTWLGVWRPAGRQLRQLRVPDGWLAGAGLWTRDGELLLPYATDAVPCGVARMAIPLGPAAAEEAAGPAEAVRSAATAEPVAMPDGMPIAVPPAVAGGSGSTDSGGGIVPDAAGTCIGSTASPHPKVIDTEPHSSSPHPRLCRPVPLQQAPLAAREALWSAHSRPVTIRAGATQPVDPATDSAARVSPRR